jgi:hypothetical protein
MDYRDERDALRARVEKLEADLAHARAENAALRGGGRARRTRTIGVVIAGAAALGLVAAVALVRRSAPPQTPTPTHPPITSQPVPVHPEDHIAPRSPMFAHVDADDVLDPIAWMAQDDSILHPKNACLAAFSGLTGKPLWRDCSFASKALDDARSAVHDDLVYVDFERHLHAVDMRTGARRFRRRLDERLMEYCKSPDGTLRISLEQGGATFVVTPATGELAPSTRVYDCVPAWDDHAWRHRALPGQHVTYRGHITFDRDQYPPFEGLVPETRVTHGGRTVLLGYARPGAHVPFAALVDEKGTCGWKRSLVGGDPPPEADDGGPFFAALDDERLCAPYQTKAGYRLGCWKAASGDTLWDTSIEFVGPGGIHGIALTPHHVVLRHWSALSFFDRATGKLSHHLR